MNYIQLRNHGYWYRFQVITTSLGNYAVSCHACDRYGTNSCDEPVYLKGDEWLPHWQPFPTKQEAVGALITWLYHHPIWDKT